MAIITGVFLAVFGFSGCVNIWGTKWEGFEMHEKLIEAIQYDRIDEATGLIESIPDSMLDRFDRRGTTALAVAAASASPKITEQLLARGVNPNRGDRDGTSPLWKASLLNRADVAEILLKAGADPNLIDADGATPLDMAYSQGNYEVAKIVVAHGGRIAKSRESHFNEWFARQEAKRSPLQDPAQDQAY